VCIYARPELLEGPGKFFGVYHREQRSMVKEVEKQDALQFLTDHNINN
jgi:hypothetical protein